MAVKRVVPPLQLMVPAETPSDNNGETEITIELLAALHGPAGSLVVKVSVTEPEALSFAPGV